MKKIFLFALAAIVAAGASTGRAQFKKYDIKSGIVTYDLAMKVGSMEMKQKVVVYFDDYGLKECKESYSDGKLKSVYLSDGKQLYSLNPESKRAFSRGTAYRGTELRVEWTEFGSAKDRESGKIKKIPAMTVAGKSCETFQTNDGKGNVTTYAGWKKILMYLDVKQSGVQSTQKAIKVEENAKVPADKFVLPKGYTIQ